MMCRFQWNIHKGNHVLQIQLIMNVLGYQQ